VPPNIVLYKQTASCWQEADCNLLGRIKKHVKLKFAAKCATKQDRFLREWISWFALLAQFQRRDLLKKAELRKISEFFSDGSKITARHWALSAGRTACIFSTKTRAKERSAFINLPSNYFGHSTRKWKNRQK
jgi:hypothetical protein